MTESDRSGLRLTGGVFTLPILELFHADPSTLRREILGPDGRLPDLLHGAGLVLDMAHWSDAEAEQLGACVASLRDLGCTVVGVRQASEALQEAARKLGLATLRGRDQGAAPPSAATQAPAPVPDRILDQPVRSGQRFYARQTGLVCLGVVNAGAEVLADGHLHVYGALRGRAMAGVSGASNARIFCHSLEAELVAIAGVYRTLDSQHPLWSRPAQVYLNEEELHIIPLQT
ncbi:MAG: septum site-determining protein MinC [Acidithiobacillus sp.]